MNRKKCNFVSDSDSSIILERRRENTIPEALYCTIEEPPISASTGDSEVLDPSHRPHPVYAIPSMTSPPPTYDVAIAKTWQVVPKKICSKMFSSKVSNQNNKTVKSKSRNKRKYLVRNSNGSIKQQSSQFGYIFSMTINVNGRSEES